MKRIFDYQDRRQLDEFDAHIERGREINKEAHVLLDLIAAEFKSDPMSVQCFDLQVVDRVKKIVDDRRAWEARLKELQPF